MDKQHLIAALQLEPHTEGGYYRRTYCSEKAVTTANGSERALLSSIYYMLCSDSPIGFFHRNQSDIIHYWHSGSALTYYLVDPEGNFSSHRLGPDLAAGDSFQMTVPGGYWKATLLENGDYGLLSEAVAPGFDYADMTLAKLEELQRDFPKLAEKIDLKRFCKF
ncbi:cupin domain-containing protein [Oceanicoccus sagamiensis]|uniref:Cupin n=1 Tax=Oceanicoccus sagamiensis TaxID=716816 RepID=A0A1X9N6B6_9GAMM|nr:cupin domain-containing protein [Oceanicoccus sagamiensis]ARN73638.1 cupin [Oceanicoccus sagamiensis]